MRIFIAKTHIRLDGETFGYVLSKSLSTCGDSFHVDYRYRVHIGIDSHVLLDSTLRPYRRYSGTPATGPQAVRYQSSWCV